MTNPMTATAFLMAELDKYPEVRNEEVAGFLASTEAGECEYCGWVRDPRHNNTEAAEAHATEEIAPILAYREYHARQA